MNELKVKQKVLLDETVGHFKSDNRAVLSMTGSYSGSRCRYSHSVNGGCAIGRKCCLELADKLDEIQGAVNKPIIFNKLPGELKELGEAFLARLQGLHDGDDYWNPDGLSELGKHRYAQIIQEFDLI